MRQISVIAVEKTMRLKHSLHPAFAPVSLYYEVLKDGVPVGPLGLAIQNLTHAHQSQAEA